TADAKAGVQMPVRRVLKELEPHRGRDEDAAIGLDGDRGLGNESTAEGEIVGRDAPGAEADVQSARVVESRHNELDNGRETMPARACHDELAVGVNADGNRPFDYVISHVNDKLAIAVGTKARVKTAVRIVPRQPPIYARIVEGLILRRADHDDLAVGLQANAERLVVPPE